MTEKMINTASKYGLVILSTPEKLASGRFVSIITYDDEVTCIGREYDPDGNEYYAATYVFTNNEHTTCEDDCELCAVTVKKYKDSGHALQAVWKYSDR